MIVRVSDEVPEPPDEMLEHETPCDLHAELLTRRRLLHDLDDLFFVQNRRVSPSDPRVEPSAKRRERPGL